MDTTGFTLVTKEEAVNYSNQGASIYVLYLHGERPEFTLYAKEFIVFVGGDDLMVETKDDNFYELNPYTDIDGCTYYVDNYELI